jgi:hypothetical protein
MWFWKEIIETDIKIAQKIKNDKLHKDKQEIFLKLSWVHLNLSFVP